MRSIKKALDDAGIEIPFPYVTHTFKEAVPLSAPAQSEAAKEASEQDDYEEDAKG